MKPPAILREIPAVLREINVFVVVGVAATATQVLVSLAAQRWLGVGAVAASVVGYGASVGLSYFGNSLFTFRRPALHGPQFARFATLSLAGLSINLSVVYACTHLMGWPLWLAMIPVVLTVPASTFAMSKFWAFRVVAAEPAG
ncbi:MAG TPA: GtrA family protein [Caulobacteraceae bacterium]|jgi:putative flippase GtrA